MRRVVVTGIGIVSSIGSNRQEVTEALREGRSGIRASEEYREMAFRSQVFGPIDLNLDELIDRKVRRFMGTALPITTSPCRRQSPILV